MAVECLSTGNNINFSNKPETRNFSDYFTSNSPTYRSLFNKKGRTGA